MAKVEETVEKAPRCLRFDSCSKVKLPISLKTSKPKRDDAVPALSLTHPTRRRRRLLCFHVSDGPFFGYFSWPTRTLIRGRP